MPLCESNIESATFDWIGSLWATVQREKELNP